jgi:hypothetical protein
MGLGRKVWNVKPTLTNKTDALRGQQKTDLKGNVEVK